MDNYISKEKYMDMIKDQRVDIKPSDQLSMFSEDNVSNETQKPFTRLLSNSVYKKNGWLYIQGFIPSEVEVSLQKRQKQQYINPMPKQSFKHGIKRQKNGDPLIYFNKKLNRKDVITYSYLPAKTEVWERYLKNKIIDIIGGNFKPLEGEIFINFVKMYFKFPKATPKYKLEAAKKGRLYFKSTRPDITDNLMKPFYDAMNETVYKDDGQIVYEGPTIKLFGFIPGIEFKLKCKT